MLCKLNKADKSTIQKRQINCMKYEFHAICILSVLLGMIEGRDFNSWR